MKCSFLRVLRTYPRLAIQSYSSTSAASYAIHKHLLQYNSLKDTEKVNLLMSHSISTEKLFSALSTMEGSLTLAMSMRNDIMKAVERKNVSSTLDAANTMQAPNTVAYLRELDAELKRWLTVAFSPDMVELKRISYRESSGEVLEKIARGESVHAVRSLSELKSRLDVNGRKACFALFSRSPALVHEPLYFIHVAFTSELSSSLK